MIIRFSMYTYHTFVSPLDSTEVDFARTKIGRSEVLRYNNFQNFKLWNWHGCTYDESSYFKKKSDSDKSETFLSEDD